MVVLPNEQRLLFLVLNDASPTIASSKTSDEARRGRRARTYVRERNSRIAASMLVSFPQSG